MRIVEARRVREEEEEARKEQAGKLILFYFGRGKAVELRRPQARGITMAYGIWHSPEQAQDITAGYVHPDSILREHYISALYSIYGNWLDDNCPDPARLTF